MALFIAALKQEADGGYSVTFPSVPGAITQGDTYEEALRNAKDALDSILQDRMEHGERTTDDDSESFTLVSHRVTMEGAAPVPIVTELSLKTTRVNISIDEALLQRIDREAAAGGKTRSGFLSEAARAALKRA